MGMLGPENMKIKQFHLGPFLFNFFGQEGLKIKKNILKAKNLYSFHNIFRLLQIFQFQTPGSFVANILELIFLFWHFGAGVKFKLNLV